MLIKQFNYKKVFVSLLQVIICGGMVLINANAARATESINTPHCSTESKITTTRLHRESNTSSNDVSGISAGDDSCTSAFVNPLAGFTNRWQTKLLHHNFCPMLTCHSSCAASDNPCGYAMFYGSIMKAQEGCASGHHGQ
jgi:hypothetical protein